MAYERVSPSEKYSQHAGATALSASGGKALLRSLGGFSGTPQTTGLFNTYLSQREADTWLTKPLNLPASEFATPSFFKDNLLDLSRVLLLASTYDEADNETLRFRFRDSDGAVRQASPPLRILGGTGGQLFAEYEAGAADLSRYVISTTNTQILPGYDPVGASNSRNFYEVVGADGAEPSVRRVDLDNAGVIVGPLCAGRVIGGQGRKTNAMSADGRTIFFSAFAQAAPSVACGSRGRLRVMARLDGETTVEVSQSQCTRIADPGAVPPVTACGPAADVQFEGASTDGKVVYFTTAQQLINDDIDAGIDLYEYRFGSSGSPATLRRVTQALSSAPDMIANVQGALGVSADAGRAFRVYFAAQGRITTAPNQRGQQPDAAGNNLYLYERSADGSSSRIVFVTTMAAADAGLWGLFARQADFASDASQVLIFPSVAPLTADDLDSAVDLFRFDADTGSLRRVSTSEGGFGGNGNGAFPVTASGGIGVDGTVGTGLRSVSADGSAITFQTREQLSARDVNSAEDVYLWRDGDVSLISDGQGPEPGQTTDNPSFGISGDGSTVTFATAQRLVSADVDGANDAYVARVDGGFLEPDVPDTGCRSEACQGPLLAPGPALVPRSEVFRGPGDELPGRTNVARAPGKPVVRRLSGAGPGAARMSVRVTEAGTIRVSGSGVVSRSVKAKRAGRYAVTLRLSSSGRKKLNRRRAVKVRVTVKFVGHENSTSPSASRMSLTFRSEKSAKSRAREGQPAATALDRKGR